MNGRTALCCRLVPSTWPLEKAVLMAVIPAERIRQQISFLFIFQCEILAQVWASVQEWFWHDV